MSAAREERMQNMDNNTYGFYFLLYLAFLFCALLLRAVCQGSLQDFLRHIGWMAPCDERRNPGAESSAISQAEVDRRISQAKIFNGGEVAAAVEKKLEEEKAQAAIEIATLLVQYYMDKLNAGCLAKPELLLDAAIVTEAFSGLSLKYYSDPSVIRVTSLLLEKNNWRLVNPDNRQYGLLYRYLVPLPVPASKK